MCWKSEEGFWILSEKDGYVFGRNVVLWLHHVHAKLSEFVKLWPWMEFYEPIKLKPDAQLQSAWRASDISA